MSVITLRVPRKGVWAYRMFLLTLVALTVYHTYQFLQHTPQNPKPVPSKVIDSSGDVIYYPSTHEVK